MRYIITLTLILFVASAFAVGTRPPSAATLVPAASSAGGKVLLPLGVEYGKLAKSSMHCMSDLKDENKTDIDSAVNAVRRCMPESYKGQAKKTVANTALKMHLLQAWPLHSNTRAAVFLDLAISSLDVSLAKSASRDNRTLINTLGIVSAMGNSLRVALENGLFQAAKAELVREGIAKRNTGFMGRLLAVQALFVWPNSPISAVSLRRYLISYEYENEELGNQKSGCSSGTDHGFPNDKATATGCARTMR